MNAKLLTFSVASALSLWSATAQTGGTSSGGSGAGGTATGAGTAGSTQLGTSTTGANGNAGDQTAAVGGTTVGSSGATIEDARMQVHPDRVNTNSPVINNRVGSAVPGTSGGVVQDSTALSGAQSSTDLQTVPPNANVRIPRNRIQTMPGRPTVPATSSTDVGSGAQGTVNNPNTSPGLGIGAGTSTGLGIGAGTSTGLGIGAGTSTGQGQVTPGSRAPNGAWIPHATRQQQGTLGRGTIGSGVLGGAGLQQQTITTETAVDQSAVGAANPSLGGSLTGSDSGAVVNPAGNPVPGAAIGLGGNLNNVNPTAKPASTNATGVATNNAGGPVDPFGTNQVNYGLNRTNQPADGRFNMDPEGNRLPRR